MAQRATSSGGAKSSKSSKKRKDPGNGVTRKAAKKPAKKASREAAAKDKKKGRAKPKKRKRRSGQADDPLLFADLAEGERADALRTLLEDRRLAGMAAVGRYRVIAVEPLVVKEPGDLANRRLVRIVAYDYSADRSVHGCVDLDGSAVVHLQLGPIQPMLAREEEAAAVSIALRDERIKSNLGLGDEPQAALHYWSTREADISYRRRSAAVLFGQPGSRPSLVAVVDLLDSEVIEVVPAEHW
jgi:hypothetical protein